MSFFRVYFSIALALLITPAASLAAVQNAFGEPKFDHTHALFDSVLRKHVRNGLVNYRALVNDKQDLDRYLAIIGEIKWANYISWTRNRKLALWINAYNAFTIEAILRHYPIGKPNPISPYPKNSIRHIDGVWSQTIWTVAGKSLSLDYIEHEIMRKQLKEPRVHFVLVCASIGCPLLENRSFRADTLEQRLEAAAYNYINRDGKVRVDVKNETIWFPMIFDWFGKDFIDSYTDTSLFEGRSKIEKGLLSFIYKRVTGKKKEMMRKNNFSIKYIPYDWSLNEQDGS